MPSRRAALALLGAAFAGCAGAPSSNESTTADSSPNESESPGPSEGEADLPPVPTPSPDALDRWCAPGTGVAASQLTVLGEALGASESVVRVGFTGDGDLRDDAPTVVLSGVVDEANVGEHAYLSGVELADGTLTVSVEPGYPTETGTPTAVGMAMGVRYTARVAMADGFPEAVRVRHHGDSIAVVDGPC